MLNLKNLFVISFILTIYLICLINKIAYAQQDVRGLSAQSINSEKSIKKSVLLLSFVSLKSIDKTYTKPDPSRSQIVLLKSMLNQFAQTENGTTKFIIVDSTYLAMNQTSTLGEKTNFISNWDLENVTVMDHFKSSELIKKYNVTQVPSTLLIDENDKILNQWSGITNAQTLAFALQKSLDVTSSGRTKRKP